MIPRVLIRMEGDPSAWLLSRGRLAAQAITMGQDAASKGLQQDVRAMIRSAGLGTRLGNAIRQATYPKPPRYSPRAASEVSASGNAADIIRAFDQGVTIRGKGKAIAIPTAAVPRGRWGAKLTPHEVEMRFLRKLELRRLAGKPALVLPEARTTRAGRARAATRKQVAAGRGGEVVMFWLRDSVTLSKRLRVSSLAAEWNRRLPGIVDRAAAGLRG
jgi:hypothetical protein